MITRIVAFPRFAQVWPGAVAHLRSELARSVEVEVIEVTDGPTPPGSHDVERLFWLGRDLTAADLDAYPAVKEVCAIEDYRTSDEARALIEGRGLRVLQHTSESYWSQSVSEFALGLTIAALRGLTARSRAMVDEPDTAWHFAAEQLSDDLRFASGTIAGKRVRIVGAGNIASRYAKFTHTLGADVAAWDPFALEPSFDLSGARREHFLDHLVVDAEIFAPMVPLTPSTTGLVTSDLIDALPLGTLVVVVTRARVCDVPALRRRVLADELSLAIDVYDNEPVASDDELLRRPNVTHSPHIAGRTVDSGMRWAEALAGQVRGGDNGHAPASPRIVR